MRNSSSNGLADNALAGQLLSSVHALQQQAQNFQVREAEKMAEQREAMRTFEMRQEMQLQAQMQTMMAQMWSYMDPTTLAALSQTSGRFPCPLPVQQQPLQQPHQQQQVPGEPEPDEFDASWEMETGGVTEIPPPQR